MDLRLRQATNEYAPPPCRKGRKVNGHPAKVSQNEYASLLRLATDAWSMVIRLKQALYEYAPRSPRKGREINVHATKASIKCVTPPSVSQWTRGQ